MSVPHPEAEEDPAENSDPFLKYAARTWPREHRFLEWLREAAGNEILPLHLTWFFTLVLAVFAVAAWRDSKDTSKSLSAQVQQATKSADALENQLTILRAEQRPWVSIDTSGEPTLRVHNRFTFARVDVILNNSGRSPARFTSVTGNLIWAPSHRTVEMYIKHQNLDFTSLECKFTVKSGRIENGSTVFPATPTHRQLYANMIPRDFTLWQNDFRNKIYGKDLIIVGCVDYVIGDDIKTHHQTSIAYILRRNEGHDIDPDKDGIIESKELKITPVEEAVLDAN